MVCSAVVGLAGPPSAAAYSLETGFVGVGSAKGITLSPGGFAWMVDTGDPRASTVLKRSGPLTGVSDVALSGQPNVTALALGSDGLIWVATSSRQNRRNATIYRFRPDGRFISRSKIRGKNFVFGLSPGPDGRMWAVNSVSNNILALDARGQAIQIRSGTQTKLESTIQGSDGTMWACGLGLLVKIRDRRVVRRISLEENLTCDMSVDSSGGVFVPSGRAIQHVSGNGDVRRIDPWSSQSSVLSVFRSGSSIGFAGGGLNSDSLGPYISGSKLGVLDVTNVAQVSEVFRDGIEWASNFDDETTSNTRNPGMRISAVDGQGNLWAGTSARAATGYGLVKFKPSVAPVTGGQLQIVARKRSSGVSTAQVECLGDGTGWCSGKVVASFGRSTRWN